MGSLLRRRDVWAGLLLLVVGLGTVLEGRSLTIGSLTDMGPGYVPTALGALLAVLGLAIALTAPPPAAHEAPDLGAHDTIHPPDWRGIAAILAGIVLFIVLGTYAGLVPATFACVFTSAMGDRVMTLRAAALLAAAMTIAAVVLFHYALQVQFPLLTGLGQ